MNKKIIFILIIICCVLLLSLILIQKNFVEEDPVAGHIDGSEMEGLLTFSGMGVFAENYTGNLENKEITTKIKKVLQEDIIELYNAIKKADENELLKKYYTNNKTSIEDKFGIQSEEDFISFSNKIIQKQIKLDTLQKVKINKDSFVSQSDKTNYAYVEFDAIFENDEKISFSMYVANKKILVPQFIFSIK